MIVMEAVFHDKEAIASLHELKGIREDDLYCLIMVRLILKLKRTFSHGTKSRHIMGQRCVPQEGQSNSRASSLGKCLADPCTGIS